MGLANLVEDDSGTVCPECDEEAEETPHWYWRCRTDGCEVITFRIPDYSVDL